VAATPSTTDRALAGEKAGRIVDAMRSSVARRGVAGATFDHVAREAGVSRGLLHYYFGTKERLLAEVVRRDADVQLARLDAALADAGSADEVLERLVSSLSGIVENEPETFTLLYELFTLSRRNEDVAAEFAALTRRARDHVAVLLDTKAREGAVALDAPATAVADLMFAIADGLALRMLADPEHDWAPALEAGIRAVRPLLGPA
jgi:AcrR family transcriptional regulator